MENFVVQHVYLTLGIGALISMALTAAGIELFSRIGRRIKKHWIATELQRAEWHELIRSEYDRRFPEANDGARGAVKANAERERIRELAVGR
jgi:hypothetical protein